MKKVMQRGDRVVVSVPGSRVRHGIITNPMASCMNPDCARVRLEGVKEISTIHRDFIAPEDTRREHINDAR